MTAPQGEPEFVSGRTLPSVGAEALPSEMCCPAEPSPTSAHRAGVGGSPRTAAPWASRDGRARNGLQSADMRLGPVALQSSKWMVAVGWGQRRGTGSMG